MVAESIAPDASVSKMAQRYASVNSEARLAKGERGKAHLMFSCVQIVGRLRRVTKQATAISL
jgi:hypothetical protein